MQRPSTRLEHDLSLNHPLRRGWACWFAAIVVFLGLASVALSPTWIQSLTQIEKPLLLAIHQHENSLLNAIAIGLSVVGGLPVMACMVFLVASREFILHETARGWIIVGGFAGATLTGWTMKWVAARPRPELWSSKVAQFGDSFPSGHSIYAMAFALILIMINWRSPFRYVWILLGLGWAMLMAFSRMYLGVHYPSDVVGGISLAVIWMLGLSLWHQHGVVWCNSSRS